MLLLYGSHAKRGQLVFKIIYGLVKIEGMSYTFMFFTASERPEAHILNCSK